MQSKGVLAAKFRELLPHLDERARRLVLGAEARALGHGGIGVVAAAAGVSRGRVSRGADEVAAGTRRPGQVRRPGAGRKRVVDLDAGLVPALMGLVEPGERCDPMSPLRWTTRSVRHLAAELTRAGHRVGRDTVAEVSHANGFSLQGASRTLEGIRHPDRDRQFRYISELVAAFQRAGQPVVSVDAGGSNSYRTRAWKVRLGELARQIGVQIVVCHFPPGCWVRTQRAARWWRSNRASGCDRWCGSGRVGTS